MISGLIRCWCDGLLEVGDVWLESVRVDSHFAFIVTEFKLYIIWTD